jgi:hypothetical protein
MKRLTTFICDVFGVEAREEKRREEKRTTLNIIPTATAAGVHFLLQQYTLPTLITGPAGRRLTIPIGRCRTKIGKFGIPADDWNEAADDFHYQSADSSSAAIPGTIRRSISISNPTILSQNRSLDTSHRSVPAQMRRSFSINYCITVEKQPLFAKQRNIVIHRKYHN